MNQIKKTIIYLEEQRKLIDVWLKRADFFLVGQGVFAALLVFMVILILMLDVKTPTLYWFIAVACALIGRCEVYCRRKCELHLKKAKEAIRNVDVP